MKLFRSLRVSSIDKRKFKNYLLYAIGEIFLVMIGITLAFQLDNWNNNRIKKNTAIGHYKNIKNQLTDDMSILNDEIQFNKWYYNEITYASKIIRENDRSQMDTLGLIMRNMTQYSDFDKEGNLYETLLNSGEIKLLNNQDIVHALQLLEEDYNYLNRMEAIHFKAVMDYVVESTMLNMSLSTGEIMNPDLVYSYQFENLVLSLLSIMKEKEGAYNQTLNRITEITKAIDTELSD